MFAGVALAAVLAAAQARADLPLAAPSAPAASHWNDASREDYRKHLQALTAIVEACAKARDMKACDPALVGQDDRVPAQIPVAAGSGGKRRLVRYGWLRVLLSKAQDKDVDESSAGLKKAGDEESARPPKPSTTQLLKDAETRLAQELAQSSAAAATSPAHDRERAALHQVLASREFRNLEETTAKDTVLEKLGTWLNQVFEGAAKLTAHAAWVGRAIVWGFILVVCVGLVWLLIQLERKGRIRLAPESGGPAPGAASARDWQLWLEDARKAAAAGQWREAIHFAYWAAISRLEARRLWPADRARTPREYLALVAAADPRRAGLAALTGSFERFWYGGRAADENDYRRAEQLAGALIAGSKASGGGAQ
ncbi:MAG: DUF4129 domain-containing protein [Terracidiphilus sp.]|nr:DUF4129 domain-containing protein [Terracidiphilus sp.]